MCDDNSIESLVSALTTVGGRPSSSPRIVYGHRSHRNVGLPVDELPHDAVPLSCVVVVHPVHLVWYGVDLVLKQRLVLLDTT